MAEHKVHEKDFNPHTWFATIPMTDDVYLGIQAQNIARVEMNVVRRWEREVLDEQAADPGNYHGPKYRELMALSQMWVFGLYEFLRTWRQRARLLLQFEEKYNKLTTREERDAYLKKIVDSAKDKARLVTRFPVYYTEHVAMIADPQFMKTIRDYWEKTEDLYKELSAVRMPAAKHELPKKRGKEALLADAPGVGLPDPYAGSINWKVLLDDKQTTINRRNLADKFFGILGWHEDIETAVQLAKEAKARRKRLRREARRHARNPPPAPRRLDQFFRTEKEAKYDEQPVRLMRTRPQELRKKIGDRKRCIKERKKLKAAKREHRPPDSEHASARTPS